MTHKLWAAIALLLLRPPSGNCFSDSLSIVFPGGWRRSRSSARGKPGSESNDVPPTNASDCPSSLAMAFCRQIRNEPSLCSSIILRHCLRHCQENRTAPEDAWYLSPAALRAVVGDLAYWPHCSRPTQRGNWEMPYPQGKTTARFSAFTATLRALHQRSSRELQRIHHG